MILHSNEQAPIDTGRPKRRGRAKRIAKQSSTQTPIMQRRNIPSYQLLSESALGAIEAQADWLMENVGVEFRSDQIAIDLFREAGATVEGESVKFEPGLLRQLCSTAPKQFDLHSRNSSHSVTLGSDNVVLMPGYGSPFVTDLDKGRRYATRSHAGQYQREFAFRLRRHYVGCTAGLC